MKTLVFTEQFYYPEGWGGAQLPRDLTMHLSMMGVRVEVICGSDQYVSVQSEDRTPDPRAAGVVIRRIPRVLGGTIHRFKLAKQLFFCCASVWLLIVRKRPDLYVSQTNPPLVLPLVALVACVHRRPFVIIAQDVYPEVLFAHGVSWSDRVLGKLLSGLFAWTYSRADKVVALGDVMARRLVAKGVQPGRIEVISNWATGAETVDGNASNELRSQWGLAGHFVILYSGNLGIAHDVETPILALQLLLRDAPRARLVFVGQGSRLAEAKRAVERANLRDAVQFRPPVSSNRLPQSLGVAQVALVTLRKGFEGLVVPSKLLGYMARGIPTVYVGPHSDVELMLTSSGGGRCFRNGDAEGLAQQLLALISEPGLLSELGTAAERYYRAHLNRAVGLKKYSDLVESVT